MFRKFLGALTSTAVVAGLATAGVVATATPAAATDPVTNPSLAGCGIPITLVMDASGSINSDEQTAMRNASKAFLQGLKDTGSSARIIDFATDSRQLIARTPIKTGTDLSALETAIDTGYYSSPIGGGWTNWESPLWRSTQNDPDLKKGLVVFLTDGDPNTVGLENANGGAATPQDATNAAQVYADALKTAGNRMLAVGIGMNSNPDSDQAKRLKQISGNKFKTSLTVPPDTINDVDVLVTSDFAALETALKRVAASLCGGSVTIVKKTDDATAGTYAPRNGWQFTARVTPGTVPTDFTWLKPDPAETSNTATGTTATANTNPPTDGVVQFQYSPQNTTARTVRVTESIEGYTPRTSPNGYSCKFNGLNEPYDDQSGPLTISGGTAYFDITLQADQSATCEVFNTRDRASLTVKKLFDPKTSGFTGKFAIKVDCDNNSFDQTLNLGKDEEQTISGIPTGTKCEVTEPNLPTAPTGWTFGTPTVNPSGQQIIGPKNATVAVNVTNTISRNTGTLKVTKVFESKTSGYDKAFTIDYKCEGEAQGTVSLKADESKTIDGIPTGTECTVSEVKPTDPPAGWSFSDPVYDPADGKVKVTEKNQTVSVTVTNEILKPGINVVKTADKTQVNPGETVTYTYTVTNPGDTPLSDVTVTDDKCSPVTFQGGDTNGDNKLQTTETWTYTCSQALTVATTNTATVTGKDKNGTKVTDTDTITVPVVSPVVVKKICPIDVTLHKPQPTKVGNRIMTDKIKTKKSSCVLLKPVVLCRPIASSAAGETAFCDTKVTKKGRITVKTKGYEAVRVSVIVRTKPKPGFSDRWKPDTWRKSWKLK